MVELCWFVLLVLMFISLFVLVSGFASANRADEMPQPDLGLLACPQAYRIQARPCSNLLNRRVCCGGDVAIVQTTSEMGEGITNGKENDPRAVRDARCEVQIECPRRTVDSLQVARQCRCRYPLLIKDDVGKSSD